MTVSERTVIAGLSRAWLAVFFVAIAVTPGAAPALEPEFSVSGYYKSFSVVYDPSSIEDLPSEIYPENAMGAVSNRLRLNIRMDVGRALFEFSYDISPRIQDPKLYDLDLVAGGPDRYQYRFDDFKNPFYPDEDDIESFAVFHNLDRALMELRAGPVDLIVGRQPVSWGSSRSISPTDILAPFRYEELDTEDRVGVDAVRARIPIGFMGEADLGCVFGEDFEDEISAFFARGKYYVLKTDVSLIGLGFRENLMVGLDLARAVGGAGTWLEVAYVAEDAFGDRNDEDAEDFFRATAGFDYVFRDGTYIFAEYHYSGIGSDDPEDYLHDFLKPLVSESSVYLMGKHYLAPGITYTITPLTTLTGQALVNLTDFSLLLAPQIEYNVAENIYVSGGAFIGTGDSPTLADQGPNVIEFETEFGGYPKMFYGAFKIYF
jgi:hypothetical protein